MQTAEPFVSFGQNGEDVVLNRVLGTIDHGSYIEVGANHPRVDSISRSFYERGWSGVAIEPNPAFAAMFRAERPRDIVVEAAVTDSAAKSIAFHVIEGTGLSTLVDEISEGHSANGFAITELEVATARLDSIIEDAGLSDVPIHFLMIDTEGAELQVLRSIDLTRYRPWILVIEATQPGTTTASYDSWEALVLDAGYEFCLFDGLSRFYVASEMSHLKPLLSFPASAADRYVSDHERRVQGIADSASLRAEHAERAAADAIAALESVKRSVSWRLTRPLRGVRQLLRRN